MPKEIERKYLVKPDLWRQHCVRKDTLRDGLISHVMGRKVRIRVYNDTRAVLTLKGPRQGISRDEFEYEIPTSDGLALLRDHCDGLVLEKTRHYIAHAGHEWIVDEYDGLLAGVILAEIELPTEDTAFATPDWIDREVTGDPRYQKVNMLADRLQEA
ncbi:CYTH domain-containing protein [Rhodobacteraceae bacterium]|nr:CYTH domain-containing protein [Paracoccaceae bacterium]